MNIPNDLKRFRADFANAVVELEKQYGVNMNIGSITYEDDEFRTKLTVKNGTKETSTILSVNDFFVGQKVSINHKKVNEDDIFTVVKINSKNVKVESIEGKIFNATPSLLVKK